MSPNKRKITDTDVVEVDNSFKHRRSSLRVNLSCVSNLSDSGNGSLKQTEVECNNTIVDVVKKGKKSSKSSSTSKKYKLRKTNNTSITYNGISLKNVSIVLENISFNERVLNSTCEKLKDDILNKTKEIFNEKDELSIRTAAVLKNNKSISKSVTQNLRCSASEHVRKDQEDNGANKKIYNCPVHITPKKKTASKTETENKIGKRHLPKITSDPNLTIGSTPKTHVHKSKHINESKDKSRLSKKHLFIQNKHPDDNNIQEQNINLKDNFCKLSLEQNVSRTSPVLTGSITRLNTTRLSRQLRKSVRRNKPEGCKSIHSEVCSNSSTSRTSSISEDESIFGAVPIGYSTMNEDNALSDENEVPARSVNNNLRHHPTECSNKNVVPMDLTDTRGGFLLTEEQRVEENISNDKSIQNAIENKSAEVLQREHSKFKSFTKSVLKDQEKSDSPNDIVRRVRKSISKNTSIPVQTEFPVIQEIALNRSSQERDQCILPVSENSIRTVRSSLNVNTSIDVLNESRKIHSENKSNTVSKDTENEQESINTIRTSLQMNTSLDTLHKLHLQKGNEKAERNHCNNNSIDLDENMTLIEKLRNISIPSNNKHQSNSNYGNSLNKETCIVESGDNITNENQNRSKKNDSRECQSYVEATPYPVSRSIFLRSQLKQTTIAQTLNPEKHILTCTINKSDKIGISNKETVNQLTTVPRNLEPGKEQSPIRNSQEKVVSNDTIILNESLVDELLCSNSRKTVVIEESDDESEVEKSKNVNVTSNEPENHPAKKSKKKLLSLRDSSQLLSLTPFEEPLSPKQPVFTKRRKKLAKKMAKKKLLMEHEKNNSKHANKESKETSLSEDDQAFHDKEKKNKKSRKIISKKIVINKIVNEDILRDLQENRENVNEIQEEHFHGTRNSLNDFQAEKASPAKSQPNKPQKIIIVSTGLSKGDKSMVKSIVNALGGARIELKVSRRTTHVVTTGIRTINLLHGIIRGCWLVSLEWVLKSLESNNWLDPEKYEMAHFSRAVVENRKDRQLFGSSYIPELFATCGFIHVENGTKPPPNILKDLIKAAGGHITENLQLAKIIIGTEGLKETWVLDSITTGQLQSHNQYQRN